MRRAQSVAEAAKYRIAAKANLAKTAAANLRVKLTISFFTSKNNQANNTAEPQT